MQLVLVESPTKARKLSQFLGKDFIVEASMGHVRDLPKAKLGVDIDHDFEPEYEIVDGKKTTVTKLKKLAQSAEKVILATDPDREGEAIAWHLAYLLNEKTATAKKKKSDTTVHFDRATFHEITQDAVLDALAHPGVVRAELVDAQQARRVLDRLVGYYLSPVLWKKVRRGLSAGRVQSVALRLIVEREKEINVFIPEAYWEIDAHLYTPKQEDLIVRLFEKNSDVFEPKTQQDVDVAVQALRHATYAVKSVQKTERTRVSLPPFTTSTLQQSAANRLGWSAKQTMSVAQELYEEGYITYHRTDSVALSSQAIDAARSLIVLTYGQSYLPQTPRLFKTSSKNAQEAHEAIRVTNAGLRSLEDTSDGNPRRAKLYDLIWRRFIASQMESATYDQTSLVVTAQVEKDGYTLKTAGSVLRFDGWMKLFPNQGDIILPAIIEGENLQLNTVESNQKFTQPPARYNDASLIKTLEKLGIGRPSTYASIISVILDRGYVERKEKAFMATPIGETVSDFLVKYFPKELDYQFTAEMEDDLDSIARGEKKWKNVIKSFFEPFEKTVAAVTKDADRAKVPVEETGEMCPDCKEGKLVIRSGRFGRFISCARFPDCKYTAKLVEKVDGMKCPDCGEGDVVIKRTKRGRNFFGCSRYPACNFASWKKPGTT
ncbi:MAG: type I DNA topoisomerase [Candidatus Pacebacteria bacterium]|nr:type I DNA topoisomerase [Candidatus Paceibacterota bacterium]